MRRISGRIEGLGCLGGIALALATVGLLAVLSELQSPTSVLWTGHAVTAQDRGGVVQYSVGGVNYTLIENAEASSTPAHPVTVYYDPSKPNLALADNAATRWFDASFVGVPFLLALGVVLAAAARNRRRRRGRVAQPTGGFGQGFDPTELRARRRRVANPWADPPDRPA
ncbi:MAG: hypothetical protein M3019_04980 [Candidatus Dormibacteraeota bacterium]|nr:hypothetical protein [Candidatus Dormibacteraeota bacterium]